MKKNKRMRTASGLMIAALLTTSMISGTFAKYTTADAAQVLIPELTARGYQLVTVSELGAYRGGILPGHKYSQFRP